MPAARPSHEEKGAVAMTRGFGHDVVRKGRRQ
jgi:hypothetical protein